MGRGLGRAGSLRVTAASERASRRWLASYVDQLVSRDVSLAGAVRDPMRLRPYLQAVAASTAGTPALKTLIDAAGIERPTANAYDALLERLLVTERIPSWSSNRLNRLIRLPKRYLVDPAFISPLLGVDARAVLRDGDLLGRLLDSFVMAQLRAECTVSELSPHLFHVRDQCHSELAFLAPNGHAGEVSPLMRRESLLVDPPEPGHRRRVQGLDRFQAIGARGHTARESRSCRAAATKLRRASSVSA